MGKDYNITKTTGRCAACEKEMAPGEEFVATVRPAPDDAEEEFARRDYCPDCWNDAKAEAEADPDVLGIWRSRMPRPKEKRRTFVDDEVLISFFERLEGSDEPARVQFRFVLALILMRKKRLVYDASEPAGDGQDVWTMHFRGSDQSCQVIDPHLEEEQIHQVSRQLGDILEADL
jgi:hypothetical protein